MKMDDSRKFKEDRNVRHGLVKVEKVKAELINLKRKQSIATKSESGYDSSSPSKNSNEISSKKTSIEKPVTKAVHGGNTQLGEPHHDKTQIGKNRSHTDSPNSNNQIRMDTAKSHQSSRTPKSGQPPRISPTSHPVDVASTYPPLHSKIVETTNPKI